MKLPVQIVRLTILLIVLLTASYASAQVYPNAGDHSVCQLSTFEYGVEYTVNSVYSWSITSNDGGSGTITENSPNNTISIHWDMPGTCVLNLTETNSVGCSVLVSINVIVNPTPDPVITGVQEICKNETETYQVPLTFGNTYAWEVIGGEIIGDPNTNTVTVQWNGDTSGSLTVTETVGECAAMDDHSVTINPIPLTTTIYHN